MKKTNKIEDKETKKFLVLLSKAATKSAEIDKYKEEPSQITVNFKFNKGVFDYVELSKEEQIYLVNALIEKRNRVYNDIRNCMNITINNKAINSKVKDLIECIKYELNLLCTLYGAREIKYKYLSNNMEVIYKNYFYFATKKRKKIAVLEVVKELFKIKKYKLIHYIAKTNELILE